MPLLEGLRGLLGGKGGRNTPGSAGLSELAAAALVQEAGGRYSELCWNGLLYTLSSGLVATPAASPLAAGGTAPLALWNPLTSGFLALITRVNAMTTVQGTVSPKAYAIDVGATAAITQATITRGIANYVGASPDNDLQGFTAVALTGSTLLARLRWLHGIGNGVTAASVIQSNGPDEVSGAIILPPGTVLALTAAVAGTANEAAFSIEYAKLRIT